jgi:hypothetical protein
MISELFATVLTSPGNSILQNTAEHVLTPFVIRCMRVVPVQIIPLGGQLSDHLGNT